VSRKLSTPRPLAESECQTDGVDLLLEKLGFLVNVTREGQTEMKDVIHDHLKRIERDTHSIPIRLFLFTRQGDSRDQPSPVVDRSAYCFWASGAGGAFGPHRRLG
jgi:hypothetical protein